MTTVPPQAVEAAAKADYESLRDEDKLPWDEESEEYREVWRKRVRPLIEAAAPYIEAQALMDAVDYLADHDENDPVMWLARQVKRVRAGGAIDPSTEEEQ
jgi:hypothetical protein